MSTYLDLSTYLLINPQQCQFNLGHFFNIPYQPKIALPTADPNLRENIDAETVRPSLLWPDIHSLYSEQSVYIENNKVMITPKKNTSRI